MFIVIICIPIYNVCKYLERCIDSLLNQTYPNVEYIFVDDCSTDDSLEKIRNLVSKDHRFKIYTNEENKGVGYTKKRCIELANGDICGFLDPDDALLPNALQLSVDTHNKYKNIDVKIATGGTLARKYVKDLRPDLIIAVACKRDLISGIRDAEPFLVYGVFNKIKNESCINTTVAIEDIYAILEEIS